MLWMAGLLLVKRTNYEQSWLATRDWYLVRFIAGVRA